MERIIIDKNGSEINLERYLANHISYFEMEFQEKFNYRLEETSQSIKVYFESKNYNLYDEIELR